MLGVILVIALKGLYLGWCRRGKIVFRSFRQDPGVDVIEGVTGESSSSSSSIVLAAETGVNQEHGTGTVNDESSVPIPDIEPLFPLLQVRILTKVHTWLLCFIYPCSVGRFELVFEKF